MWKIFFKEVEQQSDDTYKVVKKKIVKKGTVKKKRPVSKSKKRKIKNDDESIRALKIIEKTLDRKLEEVNTKNHDVSTVEVKKIETQENEQAYNVTEQTEKEYIAVETVEEGQNTIGTPNNIIRDEVNEIYVVNEKVEDAVVEQPKSSQQQFTIEKTSLIQIVKNIEDENNNGLLYGVIVDNRFNNIVYEQPNSSYNFTYITDFVEYYRQITGEPTKNNEQYMLFELEKNIFFYIQFFSEYYFGFLFSRDEVSFGQLLNIVKPNLINDYRQLFRR